MKKTLIFLCSLILLFTCRPGEAELSENSTGLFNCKLNGTQWTRLFPKGYVNNLATTIGPYRGKNCTENYCQIGSNLIDKKKMPQFEFSLSRIPLMPGRYPFTSYVHEDDCEKQMISGAFGTLYQGDLSGDTYYSIPSNDGHVTIESYNKDSQILQGSFQMVAVLAQKGPGHFLPDTIRFTNGRFLIRLGE